MNIVLWIFQGLLAFYYVNGGIYKLAQYDKVANVPSMKAVPKPLGLALGVVEVIMAVLLVNPRHGGLCLSVIAALFFAVEGLALTGMHYAHGGKFGQTGYFVIPAILAAFVAYGRWAF